MQTIEARHRVFLIDEHPIVLEGLADLVELEPDLVACGRASDAASALLAVTECRPDLVVLELGNDWRTSVESVESYIAAVPTTAVLVLTEHDTALQAERVLRAGARGYVSKRATVEQIVGAIRELAQGGTWFGQSTAGKSAGGDHSIDPRGGFLEERLTVREREVLQRLGESMTLKQIGNLLGLSPKTVEGHRTSIKSKLRLRDTADVVRLAVEWVDSRRID